MVTSYHQDDSTSYGRKGGLASKHHWNESERIIVRRDYQGTNDSARRIAQRLGVSFNGVKGQIQKLGIAKIRHYRWTPEEDMRLRELLGEYAPITVAKLMKRSVNSVTVHSKRLGIYRRYRDGWYTKNEVREIFGVDHKWVQARIDNGALGASWHHEHRPQKNGGGSWHISEKSLREFIKNHSYELTGRNVDLIQIVSILTVR